MNTIDKDELDYREIRNLRQYHDIWGQDCPTNELPYLIVFRGNDFHNFISQLKSNQEKE